jgi:hypothetical protein
MVSSRAAPRQQATGRTRRLSRRGSKFETRREIIQRKLRAGAQTLFVTPRTVQGRLTTI